MNIERSVDIVLSTSDDGCVGNRSTSFGDEVDFLSCWSSPTKPTDTSQYNVGSMNDFTEAAARFSKKEPNNLNMEFGDTAMWANATARSLRIHNALESSHGIRCGNDLLETDSIEEDDASCNVKGGLDALLELFDATISNASNGLNDHSQKSIQEDNFDSDEKNLFDPDACLTPRGKKVAEGIEGALVEDNNKLDVIKRSCPNWKENIRYAQLQTDPQEVDAAFQKVIEARKNLAKMKESIMQAFLERDSTLELYEQSLKGSLKRLVGVDDT